MSCSPSSCSKLRTTDVLGKSTFSLYTQLIIVLHLIVHQYVECAHTLVTGRASVSLNKSVKEGGKCVATSQDLDLSQSL